MAEYEAEEASRKADIKDRDEFVKRLLDRDSEATKKSAPSTRASKIEEASRRLESGEVVSYPLAIDHFDSFVKIIEFPSCNSFERATS